MMEIFFGRYIKFDFITSSHKNFDFITLGYKYCGKG